VIDRRSLALGSALMAAGVGLGVAISHCGGDRSAGLPSVAVTATVAPLHEAEVAPPPPAPSADFTSATPPAALAPVSTPWPVSVAPAAPRDAAVAAAPPPAAEPASSPPPATTLEEPPPPPPAPAPAAAVMTERRNTDPFALTRSSFDDEDKVDDHPVSDHVVTRSSFDDEDKVDDHPTGR
jgi:hypothetical protein